MAQKAFRTSLVIHSPSLMNRVVDWTSLDFTGCSEASFLGINALLKGKQR